MKTKLLLCTAMLVGFSSTAFAQAGRQLDLIGFDDSVPAPLPSFGDDSVLFIERPVVGIFWDERCASVEYTFNSTVGANPGTPGEITPEALVDIVQTGLDRWNDNPSSYIEMNVTNTTDLGARPRVGGDFINEITFLTPAGFTVLASSPSFSLSADDTFAAGEDLDGDGDSDVFDPVAAGQNTCFDIDGDGDIEFPAGDYAAGTILDNDVQFSSTVLWETTATNGGGADVDAVSTHEFGHSHGLNHSLVNQISPTDGTGATMFPFVTTTQANNEEAQRTLSDDDLAASAFLYQEGNGTEPISGLQRGDVAFSRAYGVIRGTASTSEGTPLPGAAVRAIDFRGENLVATTYTGKVSAFQTPAGGLIAAEESAVNGDYALPVLSGSAYTLDVEAIDGNPAPVTSISTTSIIASIIGLTDFPEEAITRGFSESSNETRPLRSSFFTGIGTSSFSMGDFTANEEVVQRTAGALTAGGTAALLGANDVIYAEMFDREEVSQLIAEGNIPVSGGAETILIGEAASVMTFSNANLSIGIINADGNVEITEVLSNETDVVGQDGDLASFAFTGTRGLPFRIRRAFNQNPDAQLFFTLEINDIEVGPNAGFPLGFVGLDGTIAGTSFLGIDGGDIAPFGATFAMELRYANTGRRVSKFLTRF